jgi:hypothetical protein
MTGMNINDIIGEAMAIEKREVNRQADRLMEMLDEHVPATQKEAFMVRLSAMMESLGDTHPARIAVFNEVHRRLHAENQQR